MRKLCFGIKYARLTLTVTFHSLHEHSLLAALDPVVQDIIKLLKLLVRYSLSLLGYKTIKVLVFFVSPAKQKRDICTAFPAASLSSSAAAA